MSENEDFPTLIPFTHTFDYSKTVEQLLTEGEYDGYVDRAHITQKNFPVTEKGVVQRSGDYAHFGKNMSDAAVGAWCKAKNKRRSTAHETLTIGAADKLLQYTYSLVSGQVGRGSDCDHVGCLGKRDRQREAGLGCTCEDSGDWCFLLFPHLRHRTPVRVKRTAGNPSWLPVVVFLLSRVSPHSAICSDVKRDTILSMQDLTLEL